MLSQQAEITQKCLLHPWEKEGVKLQLRKTKFNWLFKNFKVTQLQQSATKDLEGGASIGGWSICEAGRKLMLW